MAVAYLVLLCCLAYGTVADPSASSYLSQVGAGSAAYRPAYQAPAAYGSVLGGHSTYSGLAGQSISTAGHGGVGGISSGYQHSGVYQQLPVHGSVIGHQIGAPIGIGHRHPTSGYNHVIVGPVSSGYNHGIVGPVPSGHNHGIVGPVPSAYSHHVRPSKYSHGPY